MNSSVSPESLLVLGHHDLDGMVSAAVAGAFLRGRYPEARFRYGTVDFHLKEGWASFWSRLGSAECSWRPEEREPKPDGLALVDFLYTEVPEDVFFLHADHHRNTFDVPGQTRDHLRASFHQREQRGSPMFHDATQGSCALYLLQELERRYSWRACESLREAVRVAHLVDTAAYASAREALDLNQPGPALDLLSLSLPEGVAGEAIRRLAEGAGLEEAMVRPNSPLMRRLREEFLQDLAAYGEVGRIHENGLGIWDFTRLSGRAPRRLKFAEYRDPRVQFAIQLHLKALPDGGYLVAGLVGRSPWMGPLRPDLAPPDVAKIAQTLAGGGGQPYAAGFRTQSLSMDAAISQARMAVTLMAPYLRPLPRTHPLADLTADSETVSAPLRSQEATPLPMR